MRSNYKPIGDYIRQVKVKNADGKYDQLLGINIDKFFMPSVANIVGTDLTKYKVVEYNQFACNRMHVGRDYRIPIALSRSAEPFLVSPAYTVFEIINTLELYPEYLMMWFSRTEFDREAWFHTDADVRGGLPWDLFCDIQLPIPSISIQREIVKEYNTIVNRIKLNEQLNHKLEETAQALYKHWFVDFEFPDEHGKPYKSSGGEMVDNEELDMEIPEEWDVKSLEDIAEYNSDRIKIEELSISNYISTENMLPNRAGVAIASSLPSAVSVIKYDVGQILISNIRPYFKKIWLADHSGGCSNDILCFRPFNGIPSQYLYFLLEQDLFFDYVMKGAKGTKMPRGDKNWIMNYKITSPPKDILEIFTRIIQSTKLQMNLYKKSISPLNKLGKLILSKMAKVEEDELRQAV